jgi:3-hydroxybutyryl-CoA dehydrogenase
MQLDEIRTVAVLGAGTMGGGIAHVFARSGYDVILRDVSAEVLERTLALISANLDREIKKGKVAATDKPEIRARLHATTDADRLNEADFAVEAVPERLELKRAALAEADRILRPEVILASNTSSISIATLAAATSRPDRFLGMHFMNPVPVMELVEVVRAPQTSDATLATTMQLARALGKTPVAVNDAPGFVANRVLMPMINEAAFAVMEGVATPEAVDAVMRTGMNHPMGPLELADLIGIDVCVDIMDVLEAGFPNAEPSSKYSACPLLREMVSEGRLGRKSGRGFYTYDRQEFIEYLGSVSE